MATSVLILFSTWILCAVCGHDIHKRMTVEELRNTFHVNSHDLVPEYDIVNIHHIATRSIDSGGGANIFRNSDKTINSNDKTVNNNVNNLKISAHSKISESAFAKPLKNVIERGQKAELRLKAFGTPMNLSLVKTEGLIKKGGLKVWTVEPNATAQHGVEYVEIPQTNDDIGDIYQDEENQAAILLRNDERNGEMLVEGSIGGSLVIRPLPTRLRIPLNEQPPQPDNMYSSSSNSQIPEAVSPVHLDLSDDEMYLDQEDGADSEVAIDTGLPIKRKRVATKLAQHVVFKRTKAEQEEDHLADYALMEPDHLSKRYRRKRSLNDLLAKNMTSSRSGRSKREAPYIIYPEILVIVDYDGYRLHDGDNVKIKRYFVSFWNGVDLRYKLLKGPKIRISIAGIIISRGRDATPYLERNRVGRDAIDSAAALTDMGKYLFRERRLPVYDIAVAITKLDMCRRQYANDVCNRGTAGFAYVGGACVVNKRLEKVNSVAIIEDTGGFSGIIVAAHEVGHLLGAVHDGSPPPSYLGGPGAEKCRWEDGYIMSDLRHTERGFRWSPCSVASFHHFLNGDTATCLYNAPHEDDSLPRVLPGKLLTLDAQCRKDRGTSACFKDDRVCAQLFCFDAGSGYCVAYRPAAEGSPCGDGQYCLNGRCVAEHENIIPDYSQNTPSYIRRNDENQGRPLFYEEEEEVQEQPTEPPQYYQPQTHKNPYNILQYQDYSTTQNPYTIQQQNYYSSTPSPYNFYTTPSTTTIKQNIFNNFYTKQQQQPQQTTKNPYFYFSSTVKTPTFLFGRLIQSTQKPPESQYYTTAKTTTLNPYIGNYYNLRSKTTKSPYDFANFGRTTKKPNQYNDEINNNYLKRSYNTANYYGANSNQFNVTVGHIRYN